MIFNDIIKTLKINHYVKNIAVLLPIFFSMNLTNITLLYKEMIMFVSFCLMSSCVYIFNDIVDIEKDKLHPEKSKRPIPSGRISKLQALFLFVFLFVLSIVSGWYLNVFCAASLFAYFILNVFYSLKLKDLVLIDVVCIAFGFILRVLAGCAAIWVEPSALIILLTFFMSMFFTFSKRKLELKLLKDTDYCRKSIKNCSEELFNQFILINAILSIAFYFTYVLDEKTISRAGTPYLWISVIPFTLIFFRILYLMNNEVLNDDPMHFIEKDIPTIIFILTFFVILFTLLLCI